MKKKIAYPLTFLITVLMCTVVLAESNVDYTGPIDTYTGLPTNGNDVVAAKEGLAPISKNVAYDFAQGKYMIYLDDSATSFIYSNIVSGMITSDAVSFSGDLATQAELLYNGETLQNPQLDNITEPGDYTLILKSGANTEGLRVNFTIASAITSKLASYDMPTGFVVLKVTHNGEEIPWSSTFAEMNDEGDYVIEYRCNPNKKTYKLKTTIDRTPPELALTAVVDGVASGPVSLEDVEEGASVHIIHEGKERDYTKALTTSGNYLVTITDAAQNSTSYQFTILVYFNDNSFVLFALLLGGAAALFAYIKITKKRMKIC